MRKIFLLITILIPVLFFLRTPKETNVSKKPIPPTLPAVEKKGVITTRSLQSVFMPYWSLNEDVSGLEQYDRLFYFPDSDFKTVENFMKKAPPGKVKFLTLKVFDLNDGEEKTTKQAIDIAKQYRFDGIVLDLEINSLFGDRIKNQITGFVQQFSSEVKKENLKFLVTLYGDVFYRKRPYDVSEIAKSADEVLVMAYDFHKSKGEPGPNFPFSGKQKYGYDFQTMISDFLRFVPQEKLTVIFGLFGYDWMVDEKKRPIKPAKALTVNEIRKKFLEKCEWRDCLVKRDDRSRETEIDYIISTIVNDFGYLEYHIVWFEDEESASVKKDYLKSAGIGSVAYWAHGYF